MGVVDLWECGSNGMLAIFELKSIRRSRLDQIFSMRLLWPLSYVCAALAFFPPLRRPGYLDGTEISIDASAYPAFIIDIPIDHYNDADTRTYKNRYWINAKYYQPGGPVFFFDAGEQNASPLVPYFLYEAAGPSSVMTLARRFHGIGLIFEHRFYGDPADGSFPFPMNASGMAEGGYSAYKYLDTEQSLQDAVYFAHHFEPPGLEQYWVTLKPQNAPWVWLGGSYPGIRGAHMRVRNPEAFFAAWASSAPTQAVVDMWMYWAQAERSMTRNCSTDYTQVTNYVDTVLVNGSAAEKEDLRIAIWTAVNSGPGGESPTEIDYDAARALSDVDIASYLLLPLTFYQYYGFAASVQPFCDTMQTFNQTLVRTTDNGGTAPAIASESGIAISHNITAAWKAFLVGIAEIDYDRIPRVQDPIQDYSWKWQYCSEYGYYENSDPSNPHTIQSRFLSVEHFQEDCRKTFPVGLPLRPDISVPNVYGGWHINPSNTMFTDGEFDPWRALSPSSTEADSPHRKPLQAIPECNVPPPNGTVFGMVYRGMVHVTDMRALLNTSDVNHQHFRTVGFSSPINTEPFYAGVGLFHAALEKWLPCFGNGTYGSMVMPSMDGF